MSANDREGSRQSPGYASVLKILDTIQHNQRLDAVVKQTNPLKVDIYGGGLGLDGQAKITAQPTRQDITAYTTYYNDTYKKESRVQVVIIEGLALIVPPVIPIGRGRGKILGIFDDGDPGSIILGYPIFSNIT